MIETEDGDDIKGFVASDHERLKKQAVARKLRKTTKFDGI
jgi:hypothetical protein